MKILKLTPEVFNYYRTNTKGNYNTTYDQAARKITRNVTLAREIESPNFLDKIKGVRYYEYGNLFIKVVRGKVVDLKNHKGASMNKTWFLDKKKYIQISNQLGITDCKY